MKFLADENFPRRAIRVYAKILVISAGGMGEISDGAGFGLPGRDSSAGEEGLDTSVEAAGTSARATSAPGTSIS